MRPLVLLFVTLAACSRPTAQQAAPELPPPPPSASSTAATATPSVGAIPSAPASVPAPADPVAGFELSVKRTGACYGCQRFVESVHVDEHGRVRRGTTPKDEHDTGTLSRADMLRIARAFDGGFDDVYPAEATDGSTYVLELHWAGRVKKIQHAFGNRHVPAALLELEKLIQELTGLQMK
jgi:hypothetical protein